MHSPLVLLPESFRGGCSFGTAPKRLLPAVKFAHYLRTPWLGKDQMPQANR